MGFFLLCVIGLVVYLALRNKTPATPPKDNLEQRNQDWVSFIASYAIVARSKPEQQLVAKMLADIKDQKLVSEEFLESIETPKLENHAKQAAAMAATQTAITVEPTEEFTPPEETARSKTERKSSPDYKLDSISLLLYFGAFLFVASVGLFVGFAGASGQLRTLAVLLVTLVMYAVGVWLYKNKPALQPAGLTFAGIGIAIAPLVGLAAYNYVLKNDASVVWFATSLLCVCLYAHALVVLKRPLVGYIFIFTFLSLFESAVSISNAPVYYFGWAMALFGIALQLLSVWKNYWPELRESSRESARILLPLSLAASLMLVISQGFVQLGVSLLLGAVYYFLEAIGSEDSTNKEYFSLVAHVCALGSTGCLVYGLSHSLLLTGLILACLSLLQTLLLWLTSNASKVIQNLATVVLVTEVITLFLVRVNPAALLACTTLILATGLTTWYRQRRPDAYVVAGLAWIAIPIVIGQIFLDPHLSNNNQTWLILAGLGVATITSIVTLKRVNHNNEESNSIRLVLLLQLITLVVSAFLASSTYALVFLSLSGLIVLPLVIFDKKSDWEIISSGVVALSVIRCWDETSLLPIAILIALVFSILLALRFRSEANRWLSTALWLIVPIGLGGLTTGNSWSAEYYAWAYVLVMIALIISRAVARGVLFTSSKIPLSAYARSASLSYVCGYTAAGCLAIGASIASTTSQFQTTAVLAFISLIIFVISWYVEKRADLVALQPIVWQGILLSLIRPVSGESSMQLFLLLSTMLAGTTYVISSKLIEHDDFKKYISHELAEVALVTTFVTPFSKLIVSDSLWQMPFGLMIAGGALYDYVHNKSQDYRELSSGVVVASILWFMYFFGIRELQAYTHVIALMFAAFAYWRSIQDDRQTSDNYLYVMLGVATIPLAMQAISGSAGGVYGWWLLLEQVFFMLLGVTIKRRFVVLWGLYVAVGSVLYQLRGLGWAALTVLAAFVIGVAIYQLQKYNKPTDKD